jgi:hypothetical protein
VRSLGCTWGPGSMEPYLGVMGSVGEPWMESPQVEEKDPYHSAVCDVVDRGAFGATCGSLGCIVRGCVGARSMDPE